MFTTLFIDLESFMCPNFWFEQASGHEYQAEPIAAVKIA
jgi:hypothetical protein